MKKIIALFCLSLALVLAIPAFANGSTPTGINVPPLQRVSLSRDFTNLAFDEQIFWGRNGKPADKRSLLQAVDHSLRYLNTPTAARAYSNYPVEGITVDRVRRSLVRFRQLVANSRSPEELQGAVQREFTFYKSSGRDASGDVHFTAYYVPMYQASRVRTEEYRYPLYRKPVDLERWTLPHPTRAELEGIDGTGSSSSLRGSELVWFRDRLEAFLVHIQGSARLQLTDGTEISIGYAGSTDYDYVSLGREMANDGRIASTGISIPVIIDYFKRVPQDLDVFLPRNNRFIFFRETNGEPPSGSIGVPVTADRSIATDKAMMPPGALALVHTRIPFRTADGAMETPVVSRFVLDQDTGSAIKSPGRVDLFLGMGQEAGDRAGIVGWTGELYYLLLK
ncbi:MAG: murein transglycosylase A [Jaaginema sp. PMC 1079.18]|nr:murein transglycosylase A [Jaaginema sp. PMC 1080.18]MEC4851552.1 murein transglycosylase A [Jaaginema sp. PMC 1079.18]MEC4865305.1 murein transglycosylase A [Jaaginema sp. PMC 1078.18]